MSSTTDQFSAHAMKLEAMIAKKRNAFTSSAYFRSLCAEAFEKVDIDNNGTVDVTETYVAVLLFYSKLSVYVKGLTPPEVDDVRKIVATVALDEENVGRDEFVTLLSLLFEHLVGRVLLQVCLSFFILPIVATQFWDLYHYYYLHDNWWIPRAIGVNLFTTLLLLTATPYMLLKYESTRVKIIASDNDPAGISTSLATTPIPPPSSSPSSS